MESEGLGENWWEDHEKYHEPFALLQGSFESSQAVYRNQVHFLNHHFHIISFGLSVFICTDLFTIIMRILLGKVIGILGFP